MIVKKIVVSKIFGGYCTQACFVSGVDNGKGHETSEVLYEAYGQRHQGTRWPMEA
jgi:hypothetical protein